MASLISVLSASRAYEFPPDGVRLTVLALPEVEPAIRAAFQFRMSALAMPPNTFGPVIPTNPPGLVFQLGAWKDGNGQPVHVRELFIESRRVVITVAGPSRAIDGMWVRLGEVLKEFQPEGSPILGDVTGRRNFSELSLRLRVQPGQLIHPAVLKASMEAARIKGRARRNIFVPAIHSVVVPEGHEYPGDGPDEMLGPRSRWSLSLRLGAEVGKSTDYYSAAPLESNDHLAYLEHLEAELAPSQ